MYQKSRVIVLLAVLALILGVSGVSGQTPGGEDSPTELNEIQAVLASRINYQGLLRESGNPVTGSRDMVFSFYSDSTCTTQVGSNITKNGVAVANGLFSVNLDVPQADFNGQALWLKIAVGAVSLGCREIVAAPYALSLRPGATIDGDDTALTAISRATTGQTAGIVGRSYSIDGSGVEGYAYATASDGIYGVYGRSYGASGAAGVYGYASATTGTNFGVFGRTDSTDGRGVRGEALATTGTTYGISGRSDSPNGRGAYGWANSTTGINYGGFFETESVTGRGVLGVARATTGENFGVRGETYSIDGQGVAGYGIAATGVNIGIYGESRSPAGYAGYFRNTVAGGVGVYIEAGDNATPDLILGGNDDGVLSSNPAYDGSDLIFHTNDAFAIYLNADGAGSEVDNDFNIHYAGNVIFNVDEDGTTSVKVLKITGGADLAEQFAVDSPDASLTPTPGMVACIDVANPGALVVCNTAYARTVAGAVSGAGGLQPGMVMGQEDSIAIGDYPVALTGRVYVLVDASYGAVQPGDLLTTSNTPGHAMKVSDYAQAQGAILGKAMSGLDAGTGLVLVLVTLQ